MPLWKTGFKAVIRSPQTHVRFVPYLVLGFALLLCLLAASAFVAFEAIQSTQESTSRLIAEQNASTRLVDELQHDEDAISAILYSLMSRSAEQDSDGVLGELQKLRSNVNASTEVGMNLGNPASWVAVRHAANDFIDEVERALLTRRPPAPSLYQSHRQLIDALGKVTTESYRQAAREQARETDRTAARVQNMLGLLGLALIVAVPVAVLSIWSAIRILRTMQWQAEELATLTARTMSMQEDTARRFSRELHDQFGQTLSAVEANLVAMRDAGHDSPRVADCLALVKDAIANVRQISQLLRPSILDDFGLDASLRWLGTTFAQRTGIHVDYESTFSGRLSDESETQVFRIAQEALTNVARHSDATRVRIGLTAAGRRLILTVADNGRGLPEREASGGTGLIGMRTRAREAGGVLSMKSGRGQGVTIRVDLPLEPQRDYATENSHFVG